MIKSSKEKLSCTHCGEPCPDQTFEIDTKFFCCIGCQNVFQILSKEGLDYYYELNDKPGYKVESKDYEFLSNTSLVEELLDYYDENHHSITLDMPQIHCSSCIWLLEKLPSLITGIYDARVNFSKRKLTIQYHPKETTLLKIIGFLDKIGYPPNITLASIGNKKTNVSNNTLIIKLAVAGFFFGNSMLMSLPDYLDANFFSTSEFRDTFGYLNLLFAIPVVFFSASDYFKQSIAGIKRGFYGINVPISLGIIVIFLRSFYEIIAGVGSGYIDSLNGLVFFLLIGKWLQTKSFNALKFDDDLSSFYPLTTNKVVDGKTVPVKVTTLKPGDHIRLKEYALIPVDAKLLSEEANIDYSYITGESALVKVKKGSKVFAGGKVHEVSCALEVLQDINSSYLGDLWQQTGAQRKNSIQWIDRLARYFTPIVILVALSAGIYWWQVNPTKMWQVVTAVLIIACPCAITLSAPFTYGFGSKWLTKVGFFIKESILLERFPKIKRIIFDKTGTLTKVGEETVHLKVHNLYAKKSIEEQDLPKIEFQLYHILSRAIHPLSKAVYKYLDKKYVVDPGYRVNFFEEIPGKGIQATMDGNMHRFGSVELTGYREATAEVGKDTGGSVVYWSINGESIGVFQIEPAYRNQIFETLEDLRSRFEVLLVSGDNESQCERLKPHFDALYFNKKPDEKLQLLMEGKGSETLMLGDGLNDGPAIKEAQLGITISEKTLDFIPGGDALLLGDHLNRLPAIIQFSKRLKVILFLSFSISILYNLLGLYFAVRGVLSPLYSAILMPLSSISVVIFIALSTFLLSKKRLH